MGYKRAINKMKKFTFILAALFAATFANAQITLKHSQTTNAGFIFPASITIGLQGDRDFADGGAKVSSLPELPFYIKNESNEGFTFLNPFDFSVYRKFGFDSSLEFMSTSSPEGFISGPLAITYDIFAVDKIAMLRREEGTAHYRIVDEDGNVLWETSGSNAYLAIFKYGNEWQLSVMKYDVSGGNYVSEIYAFPGDGSMPDAASAVSTPSSPQRAIRKIARNGQVLVEAENKTYTVQGTEVK